MDPLHIMAESLDFPGAMLVCTEGCGGVLGGSPVFSAVFDSLTE
jgi:hypothetical protein